ncbi:hypothetical protein N7454_002831 [Penicillium verhagenii]|nr:hypothetical protein N7454_002831 [Penicillium verhagenii]
MTRAYAVREAVWIVSVLQDLCDLSGLTLDLFERSVVLYAENQGAIAMVSNLSITLARSMWMSNTFSNAKLSILANARFSST